MHENELQKNKLFKGVMVMFLGIEWVKKKGFFAKSRKKMKQVGRILATMTIGSCMLTAELPAQAGTSYYFNNPSSGNEITMNGDDVISNHTPSISDNRLDGNGLIIPFSSSQASNVFNNNITVNSGSIYTIFIGGDAGDVYNNTVTINNGTLHSGDSITVDNSYYMAIVGGMTRSGNASNNTVVINDINDINGNNGVVGGYADNGNANNNTVTMKDGSVAFLHGGVTNNGEVSGNLVSIKGGTVSSDVTAGLGDGSISNNVLEIYNTPNLSNAYLVGYGYSSANSNLQHSNNALNIHTKGLTAQNVVNFDNINFFLPESTTNGDTILTLTGGSSTSLTNTTIRAGVEGNANLSTGDTVTLIKNENGIVTDSTTTYGTLSEGVSLDYDLTVEQADDTSIVARVGNVAPGAGASSAGSTGSSSSSTGTASTSTSSSSSPLKAQTSILPTPMLSSSVLSLQGTDRLLEWLPPDDFGMEEESSSSEEKESEEVGKATSSGDFSIFANAGFTNLRTKTGSNSYIDSHSGGFDIGAARTLENSRGKLVFAPIIDYGTGSYDSYVNGMHGSGKTKYWAGGVIARQMNHNGFYYEASFRAGRTSVDFASNDFMQGNTPVHESYDVSAPVYAGHIRLGRLYQIDRSSQLHLYGIYAHNHQNGMTAQLATGETYHFGSVDSGRLRIGARLSWMKKKTQKFYSGIAYQYEFSNSASGTYRGYSTESSNLRGSSGMIELGWQVKPTENSPWMVDVGAVGWIGHQKGFSIQAKIKKAF